MPMVIEEMICVPIKALSQPQKTRSAEFNRLANYR